jgi:hypothetical protein
MNDIPHRDDQGRTDFARRRGGSILLVLGGAAIAVALLLPIFVLGQQANNLAIAKLQLELAQIRSSLSVQPAPGTAAATPAPPPPPTVSKGPSEEVTQVTRAITELSRQIEGLTAQGEGEGSQQRTAPTEPVVRESAPPPVPVVPRVVRRPATTPNLEDVRVRVEYQERCLQMAVKVADRLISLGANPQVVEGSRRDLQVARAMYDTEEQLSTATQIAEGLAGVTPVDVIANEDGRALEMIRLQLAGDDTCGRLPEP